MVKYPHMVTPPFKGTQDNSDTFSRIGLGNGCPECTIKIGIFTADLNDYGVGMRPDKCVIKRRIFLTCKRY